MLAGREGLTLCVCFVSLFLVLACRVMALCVNVNRRTPNPPPAEHSEQVEHVQQVAPSAVSEGLDL